MKEQIRNLVGISQIVRNLKNLGKKCLIVILPDNNGSLYGMRLDWLINFICFFWYLFLVLWPLFLNALICI
jgi:hypothetical protein